MIFQRTALAAALGAALMAAPLRAEPPEAGVIAQLQALGYENFSVSRTLLGRVRVVAEGSGRRREIVFNPSTSEILRDYVETSDAAVAPPQVLSAQDRGALRRGPIDGVRPGPGPSANAPGGPMGPGGPAPGPGPSPRGDRGRSDAAAPGAE
ncbi:hypothetical protein [Paenirhodobacter sp.]|uniref:hypothetical protein n=1 Tax=Paenirhodobacter sp. TaxID=1965326 RepID=UPI003B50CDD4